MSQTWILPSAADVPGHCITSFIMLHNTLPEPHTHTRAHSPDSHTQAHMPEAKLGLPWMSPLQMFLLHQFLGLLQSMCLPQIRLNVFAYDCALCVYLLSVFSTNMAGLEKETVPFLFLCSSLPCFTQVNNNNSMCVCVLYIYIYI